MYKSNYIRHSTLNWIYVDEDLLEFEHCPKCSSGSLYANAEGNYVCRDCHHSLSLEEMGKNELDYARDLLRAGQFWFAFFGHVTQETLELARKAEEIYLKKAANTKPLERKKELADLYALICIAYLREELSFDGIEANFKEALKAAKKQVRIRKEILQKEDNALNTFFYGTARSNLGIIYTQRGNTKAEQEKQAALLLLEEAAKKAREEDNPALFKEIKKQGMFELIRLAYEKRSQRAWKAALKYMEDYLAYAKDYYKELDIRDRISLDESAALLLDFKGVCSALRQYDKAILYTSRGLEWLIEVFKLELEDRTYWQADFQWALLYWDRLSHIRKLFQNLFDLYMKTGQKEQALKLLERLSHLLDDLNAKIIIENGEMVMNYEITSFIYARQTGEGYLALEKLDQAEKYLLKAQEHASRLKREDINPSLAKDIKKAWKDLAAIYEKKGQESEAAKARKKSREKIGYDKEWELWF